MTLAVAMIDNGTIYCGADIRLSQADFFPEDTKLHTPNYFNGVLKVLPISEKVTIAYAGKNEVAIKAIKNVKMLKPSPQEVPFQLLKQLSDGGNILECDFLVVDAENLKIHEVINGTIKAHESGRYWIGDIEAYKVFQPKLSEYNYSDDMDPINKSSAMMSALQATISSDVGSVGEYAINVINHRGILIYSPSFIAQDIGAQNLKPGWNKVTFSNNADRDSMTINLLVPEKSGVAAVGLYLNKFKRGAVYMPLEKEEPIIIEGETISQFRDNVSKKLNVQFLAGGFE